MLTIKSKISREKYDEIKDDFDRECLSIYFSEKDFCIKHDISRRLFRAIKRALIYVHTLNEESLRTINLPPKIYLYCMEDTAVLARKRSIKERMNND